MFTWYSIGAYITKWRISSNKRPHSNKLQLTSSPREIQHSRLQLLCMTQQHVNWADFRSWWSRPVRRILSSARISHTRLRVTRSISLWGRLCIGLPTGRYRLLLTWYWIPRSTCVWTWIITGLRSLRLWLPVNGLFWRVWYWLRTILIWTAHVTRRSSMCKWRYPLLWCLGWDRWGVSHWSPIICLLTVALGHWNRWCRIWHVPLAIWYWSISWHSWCRRRGIIVILIRILLYLLIRTYHSRWVRNRGGRHHLLWLLPAPC